MLASRSHKILRGAFEASLWLVLLMSASGALWWVTHGDVSMGTADAVWTGTGVDGTRYLASSSMARLAL